MLTLRITALASLVGLGAGILAGSVGGLLLTWVQFGPEAVLQAFAWRSFLLSEMQWVGAVGIAVLPGSLFCVAPLVYRGLERSFWRLWEAVCLGAGIGLAGLVFWFVVLSLFTTPVRWSRPGEGLTVLVLCVPTALIVGATIGGAVILLARTYTKEMPVAAASATRALPPPLPYDY